MRYVLHECACAVAKLLERAILTLKTLLSINQNGQIYSKIWT